ncbi:thyroglobulin type-1 repeat-containing protein [Microtetraspora fusca]|uniref:Thyroglobulin type-1 repeat-containing protein n=1 Tax=Microtetraspora fusca TaxID=1997 RepID=A0ABW6VIK8_MICFU|nr:thyroglobulin type-1 repeat-containing protein [Microtetraspora fusca]
MVIQGRVFALAAAAAALLLTTPTAHASASVRETGPCAAELAATAALPGTYTPQCTGKGYYEVIQHHGSTGYSWCVNPVTGAKIEGTEVAPGRGRPSCGTCLTQLAASYEHPVVGAYRPQCDGNGDFSRRQVNASTGMAWCADPKTGQRIGNAVRNDGTLSCP